MSVTVHHHEPGRLGLTITEHTAAVGVSVTDAGEVQLRNSGGRIVAGYLPGRVHRYVFEDEPQGQG